MAPPLQYINFRKVVLFSSLLVSFLLASSSLFVSALSEPHTQQPQIYSSQILLGRRTLLEKTSLDFDDGDEESASVPPKKKKIQKPDKDEEDEDTLATSPKKKKKVQKSDVEEDEEASLSPKKKKKVAAQKSDDGEEEALVPPKKKKKVQISDDEDDEEASLSPKKKKKVVASDDTEEALVSPKKKKQSQKTDKDDTDDEGSALSKKTKTKKKAEMEDEEEEREKPPKKTKSPSSIKPSNSSPSSTKNQPKLIKPLTSTSKNINKTKLIKASSKVAEEDPTSTPTLTKPKLKKLNSTTAATKSSTADKKPSPDPSRPKAKVTTMQKPPAWAYQEDGDADTDIEGLVSEFRDLPARFHDTLVPDLQRISATSRTYLAKANKEMARGVKPYVGNKHAAPVATGICLAFVVGPFLLVSLLFSKIKAYFSLQRLLILVQVYLSVYFSILCLSSLLTGLEPLRFFYATSRHTYVWVQVLQTLGYALYLLVLLVYLLLVFSTDTALAQKLLGLAQAFVGFAVGLHYYMTVFHRVLLRQPPKTNWKLHGIYAACFLAICLLARAERTKKAYLQEGGEQAKIN